MATADDVQNRQAIIETLTRLMRCLDHGDREGFADCWAKDVDFEATLYDGTVFRSSSRDGVVQISDKGLQGQPNALRHMIGNVEVELVDAQTADARSYSLYVNVGAEPSLAGMGEYRDRLRRDPDGRWRVARRRHVFLTPLNH